MEFEPNMSAPAWTTTYQVPLGGGNGAFKVVLVSATPWPSATTWLSANLMPPRDWQPPTWMWETCEELAPSPVILSSTVSDPD